MSSLAKSKGYGAIVATGTLAALGYMYVAGSQSKAEEGPASAYNSNKRDEGLTSPKSDARYNSQDVRAITQGERKP